MTAQALTNNGCPSSQPGPAALAIVTTPELAKIIKVAPRTISNWIATRRIPFIKIGASVRFHVPDVMAALAKFTVKEIGI